MRPIDADAVCERCRKSGAICTGSGCEIPTMPTLRPVSREQVRRGEWEKIGADYRGQGGIWRCTECRKTYPYKCDFCPNCGAPMTDEAVQMVMERMEKIK